MTYIETMRRPAPTVLNFVTTPEFIAQLDDFRFKHRFESRAAAVKWLLAWALEQNPNPEDVNRP